MTNIIRNCGSVFYALGVDLGDVDMDELMKSANKNVDIWNEPKKEISLGMHKAATELSEHFDIET